MITRPTVGCVLKVLIACWLDCTTRLYSGHLPPLAGQVYNIKDAGCDEYTYSTLAGDGKYPNTWNTAWEAACNDREPGKYLTKVVEHDKANSASCVKGKY